METLYNLWQLSKWLSHKLFWTALVNVFFVGAFHSAVWVRNDVLGLNVVSLTPDEQTDPVALDKTAKWVQKQFARK